MNRSEHLLSILAEECSEVAQRAIKALRFGLDEAQPGHVDNAYRIFEEFADLYAVIEMLQYEKSLPEFDHNFRTLVEAKKDKVEHYLDYSAQCGTLNAPLNLSAKAGK